MAQPNKLLLLILAKTNIKAQENTIMRLQKWIMGQQNAIWATKMKSKNILGYENKHFAMKWPGQYDIEKYFSLIELATRSLI